MNGKGALIGIFSAFSFIGLYWLVLNNMTADEAFQFEEVIGLVFLSLIAFSSFIIITGMGFGEVIFHFMESRGDKCKEEGNTRAARLWYQRCIRLDDRMLNNTVRRVVVMGKLSKIYNQDGHPELVHQLKLRKKRAIQKDKDDTNTVKGVSLLNGTMKRSVEANWIFKYAFVILFGTVAIVYSISASSHIASLILIFGVAINGYWLHTLDDAVS